jgi:hypothetical protein
MNPLMTPNGNRCPLCGNQLAVKIAAQGEVPGSKFLRVCSPAMFLASPKLKHCSSSATVPTIQANIISFGSRQWRATRCLLRHPLPYQLPRPPQKHLARPVVSAPLRRPVKLTLPAPGNCVAATVLKPALAPWDPTSVTATRSSSDSLWEYAEGSQSSRPQLRYLRFTFRSPTSLITTNGPRRQDRPRHTYIGRA